MNTKFPGLKTLTGFVLAVLMLAVAGPTRTAQAQESPEEPSEQDIRLHYSLYYEDYKIESYESALPNLRWILKHAPTFPREDDRNFERLIEIYEALAEKAEDPETTRAYLDSALAVHDTVVTVLKEHSADVDEFLWIRDKGRFIQSHSEELPDMQDRAIELYKKAYEMDPERLQSYYKRAIISHYLQAGDRQSALDFMENVEQSTEDQELLDYITKVRDSLFKSPEERMAFLETELEKNPEDVEIIRELFDIYLDLGYRAKAAEMGQKLLELEPTVKTYQQLAEMHLEDGEAQKAMELYENALEMPGAKGETARDIYYNMGTAQQQMDRLSNARTYYRKALEIDPNYGPAYIAIGDLYAMAVSNCGSFDREDQAVYWLVVDYYERAKSVDSSVTSTANQKIQTYRQSFPNQEALFFKNWQPGDRYMVNYGCYSWINEATNVRSPQ